MVVWCSRPRRPPEKFRFEVVQRRQEKRRDARAKSLFCQSNPYSTFLPVLLLSLHVCLDPWPILQVTMLL